MEANPQLNATLQEMIDHYEIRKMLSVYCHGCDRGDERRMASVYGKDSWDDHGRYKGPGRAYAEWAMKAFATKGSKSTHLLGQSLINVNGDRAGVETCFLATLSAKNENGEDVVTLLSGRYVDTVIREGVEWKIDKRICVRDWSITLDVNKDSLRDSNFVQGVLSGQDPSYAILGLTHPGLR